MTGEPVVVQERGAFAVIRLNRPGQRNSLSVATLSKLDEAFSSLSARDGDNTMPATIEAVRAYATLGEICDALRDVYGLYEEPAF